MSDEASNRRLGRGLAALIGEMDKPSPSTSRNPAEAPATSTGAQVLAADRTVAISDVSPNPRNPRLDFDEGDLDELSASIAAHGVVQPILVRPMDGGTRYEIIAGERRWRAAQRAQLDRIPVAIRDVDDRVALELAIVENVQRADLNPVEEALGYQQLMDDHAYRQVDLGAVIGKSRSHVANTLRLLKLPSDVRDMVSNGQLTSGHARALVTLENASATAEKIVREGLSVRQTEALVQKASEKPKVSKVAGSEKEESTSDVADAKTLAKELSDVLGMAVKLKLGRNDSGRLTIEFKTLEQLDELERRLRAAG